MDAESGGTFGQTRGFLFADLRGYTDYVERHGDDAAAQLLAIGRIGDEESELVVGRIQAAFVGPCRDVDNTIILAESPRATMEWLATRTDLTLTRPRPINVGGYPGLTADVSLVGDGCIDSGEPMHLA